MSVRWIAAIIWTVGAANAVVAQSSRPCFRPKPAAHCSSYVNLELEWASPLLQTRHTALGSTIDGVRTYVRVEDVDQLLVWRLGLMRARTATHALGGAFDIGFSGKGVRAGASAQVRRWLTDGAAIDVSAGVVTLGVSSAEEPYDIRHRVGITASTQVVGGDLFAGLVRADLVPGRRTTAAFYGGIQLRSTTAIVGTGVLAVLVALAAHAMSDPNY